MEPAKPSNSGSSVHRQYKRRLFWLVHELNRFIDAAEAKLDPARGGRIYRRVEIERFLAASKELAKVLPTTDILRPQPELPDNFLDLLAQARPIEQILEEGRRYFREMPKEEREELKRYLSTRRSIDDAEEGDDPANEDEHPHWMDQFPSPGGQSWERTPTPSRHTVAHVWPP